VRAGTQSPLAAPHAVHADVGPKTPDPTRGCLHRLPTHLCFGVPFHVPLRRCIPLPPQRQWTLRSIQCSRELTNARAVWSVARSMHCVSVHHDDGKNRVGMLIHASCLGSTSNKTQGKTQEHLKRFPYKFSLSTSVFICGTVN
jgi:hypothetical protein